MPDDLYHRDFFEWSERQAERLRRVAAGERVNDVDWEHVIEEIEDLGRSELHSVESLLTRALEHMLKAAGWPASRDVDHWLAETGTFQVDARRRFAPSMRRLIDVQDLHRDALRLVRQRRIDGAPPGPLPAACPMTLDELLDPEFDPRALAERFRPALAP